MSHRKMCCASSISGKQILEDVRPSYGDTSPSNVTVYRSVNVFKKGESRVKDL